MTAPPAPSPRATPFFLPTMGLILLFAALGPAVGGAVFLPLALYVEAQGQVIAHIGWIATLIGHAFALVPAYLLGLAPAALTGLAYALYDAWAPRSFPRALGAAAIGAVLAHGLYLWLIWAGGAIEAWVSVDISSTAGEFIEDWASGEFDVGLYRALILSGAAAGLASAAVAGLIGLTTRGEG